MSKNPSFPQTCPISGQTLVEEYVNSITHGLGFLLSIVGIVNLVISTLANKNLWNVISCSIYGFTLILLYGASTWYHKCRDISKKRILKRLDHIAIYLLIAGSYTPFALGPLKGAWGWSTLGVVWSLAIIGSVLKIFIANISDWFTVGIYLLMGWLALIIVFPLKTNFSMNGFIWLFTGGFFYSFGTIFYLWKKLFLAHSIWHLFVLAGSVSHYFCIFLHVIVDH